MFECNTGLDCEDCLGGCEQNLEFNEETAIREIEHSMLTFINMMDGTSFEKASKQATIDVKEIYVDCT